MPAAGGKKPRVNPRVNPRVVTLGSTLGSEIRKTKSDPMIHGFQTASKYGPWVDQKPIFRDSKNSGSRESITCTKTPI